jgi:translation machinery-associated protein 16
MVSNRLGKVTKKITKKKGKTPNLHEGSRDTQRLQSAAARDDKLNRLTSLRQKQNRHYCMLTEFGDVCAVANITKCSG